MTVAGGAVELLGVLAGCSAAPQAASAMMQMALNPQ